MLVIPKGLPVTNTRDEPTGKIPSFAANPCGEEYMTAAASGDLMMKFMGLTMAASMFKQGYVFSQGWEMKQATSTEGMSIAAVQSPDDDRL